MYKLKLYVDGNVNMNVNINVNVFLHNCDAQSAGGEDESINIECRENCQSMGFSLVL